MAITSKSIFKPITIAALVSLSGIAYAYNDDLSHVGGGDMKWRFWSLYEANLFTETGDLTDEQPMALSLTYKRNIKAETLVKATEKEWLRMGVDHSNMSLWVDRLFKLWPDVEKGDKISAVVDDRGRTTFYFNNESIGVFEDPEFSEVFLAIWLSEDARNQELRRNLLGLSQL